MQNRVKGCFNLRVASKTYQYIFVNVALMIFHSGLEDLLILQRISEAPIFHRSDPICNLIHILHLNSTLMLSDCVGERLSLEVTFRYWSCI